MIHEEEVDSPSAKARGAVRPNYDDTHPIEPMIHRGKLFRCHVEVCADEEQTAMSTSNVASPLQQTQVPVGKPFARPEIGRDEKDAARNEGVGPDGGEAPRRAHGGDVAGVVKVAAGSETVQRANRHARPSGEASVVGGFGFGAVELPTSRLGTELQVHEGRATSVVLGVEDGGASRGRAHATTGAATGA